MNCQKTVFSRWTSPVLVLFMVLLFGACQKQAQKPNILLILVDDLGYSDISCYGGEIRTPHIDALAEEGINILSISTSISTVTCIIASADAERAELAIERAFELP